MRIFPIIIVTFIILIGCNHVEVDPADPTVKQMHAANLLQLDTDVHPFFTYDEPILGNIFALHSDSTNRIMYTDGSFDTVNMSDSLSVLFSRRSVGQGPCEYSRPSFVYTLGQHYVVVDLTQYRVIFFPLGDESNEGCNQISLYKDMPYNALFVYNYDIESNQAKAVALDGYGGLYSIVFNSEEWKLIDSTSVFKDGNKDQVIFSSIYTMYLVYNDRVIVYPSIYDGSILELNMNSGLIKRSILHSGIDIPFIASKEPLENFHGKTSSASSGVTYFQYTARSSGMVRIDNRLILLYNYYNPDRCGHDSCLFADIVNIESMEYHGTDTLGYDVGRNTGIWNFVPYGKNGRFVYFDRDNETIKVGKISLNKSINGID